jgi:hypothetical protein
MEIDRSHETKLLRRLERKQKMKEYRKQHRKDSRIQRKAIIKEKQEFERNKLLFEIYNLDKQIEFYTDIVKFFTPKIQYPKYFSGEFIQMKNSGMDCLSYNVTHNMNYDEYKIARLTYILNDIREKLYNTSVGKCKIKVHKELHNITLVNILSIPYEIANIINEYVNRL